MMSFAQNESSTVMSSGSDEPMGTGEDSTFGDDENLQVEMPKSTPVCSTQTDCLRILCNLDILTLDDFDILELDGVQDFVMNPKKDLFGLGFDPFKNAPEFRGQNYLQSVIHPLYLVEYHAPGGYNGDVFVQSVSVLWRRTVLAMVVGKATL